VIGHRSDAVLPQLIGEERKPIVETAARALIALLIALTWIGLALGPQAGPVELACIPVCVTIWLGADLLTALMLLSQFNVDGKVSLLVVASAYVFDAMLCVPYLVAFPDVVFQSSPETIQVAAWLFMMWHIVFPICLTIALAVGFHAGAPTVDRPRIGLVMAVSMTLVVIVAGALAGATWAARRALPVLVIAHGQFTPLYSHVVAPAIVAANIVAFVLMAGPRRKRASLQSWLAVALLAALLDGVLNAVSPGRYSVSWYAGKLLATFTSTSLLLLLLVDIASLYRKLFEFASRDALTGLANRNGLHERMPAILADARSGRGDVALLVIDIDFFKKYNDTFGHAGGDDALRRVAALLKQPLRRTSDVVARIGGEEFVVLLPSTSAHGALLVGERIRADVEAAGIVNPAVPLGKVTVSIGISIVRDSTDTSALDLFAIADHALYQAKAEGRNRVVLETELRPALVPDEAVAPFADAVLGADLQARFKRGMTFPRRP
jgi:diguanylate cyclase (GGDEF)-like protein